VALLIVATLLKSFAPTLTGFSAPQGQSENIAGLVGGYLMVGLLAEAGSPVVPRRPAIRHADSQHQLQFPLDDGA